MMTEENDETQKPSEAENPEVLKESMATEPETDTPTADIESAPEGIETESETAVEEAIEQEDVPSLESEEVMVDAIVAEGPSQEIVEEIVAIEEIVVVEEPNQEIIDETVAVEEPETIALETPIALVAEEIQNQELVAEITEPEVNSTSEMLDIQLPKQEHATEDKTIVYPVLDYSNLSKESLLAFFESAKSIIQAQAASSTFKKIDEITKEAKIAFEKIKFAEKNEALASFKESNEQSEEGFSFKGDEINQKIDSCIQFIRGERQTFFQQMEKMREKALEGKTRLINELRVLADADDNSDPAHVNASFKAFKKLQDEWKSLGSVQGNMNQTLWQSYHALVDRFYSNRSIFFELLELDRKKNLQAKEAIAAKLEKLAEAIQSGGALQKLLKEAEELFEEYKHIGPAHRDANEAMWLRVKKSLDVLFEQKRQVNEAQKGIYQENLAVKKELSDLMHTYASFTSISIS
jgi:hypothetical protein